MSTVNALSVALFNAAAGGYAADMAKNPAAYAAAVGAVLEKDLSTDAAFVDHLLANFGIASTNAVFADAKAALTGMVAGQGRANAAVNAINFLADQKVGSAYAAIATAFQAKVNAAATFSTVNSKELDVSKLIAAVTGVDTDVVATDVAFAAGAASRNKEVTDLTVSVAALNTELTAVKAAAAAAATAAAAAADAAAAAATKAAADLAAANATIAVIDDTAFASESAAAAAAKTAAEAAAATAAADAKTAADAALAAKTTELATANATITALQNPVGANYVLTTATNIFVGNGGSDTFTATDTTLTSGDVIVGGEGADSMTVTAAAGASISAAAAIVSIENLSIVLNSFDTETVDLNNVTLSTVTVTNSQTAGATSVTVNNINSSSSLTIGSTFTGTLTATGSGTVNAVNAATVNVTGLTSTGITIIADDDTNTIGLEDSNAAATTDAATISGAGTVALDLDTTADDVVENLTLSGNGAAVTFDIADANTAANTIETITLTGTQSVTVIASAAALNGEVLTDNTTAGTSIVTIDTRATADLDQIVADVITYGTAGAAATLTVINGQDIRITADVSSGAGSLTIDAAAATGVSETLDLEVRATQTTNAVVVSDFETINITANDNAATTGTITIAGLTGGTSSVLNVAGADNLTLTAVTADSINASSFTGILNVATTANVDNITGGTGADVIDHDADTNFTFTGNAGDDSLTVSHALTSRTVTFNGGDGTDTLEIGAVHAATDRFTLTNVEIIDFNNNAGTYDVRDISGKTFVTVSTGGTNTSVTFDSTNSISVDLSGVTGNDAEIDYTVSNLTNLASTVSGSQIKDTISAGSGADTISGNGGADVIDGNGGTDTINGGAGADNITGGTGADALTGGAGIDTFVFADGDSIETAMDTISDFVTSATAGDVLDLNSTTVGTSIAATDVSGVTSEAGDVVTASTSANGVMTIAGANAANIDTLAEYIDAAEILLTTLVTVDAGADVLGSIAFQFNGNTYVVEGSDTAGDAYATSVVVQLTGVTGITGISTTAAANVIDIA